MYLFFDTETTGLADCRKPASDPCQPHICQLGAILCDEHGFVKAEMNLLVRPDGWVIPESATAIHGISQDAAERYGLSIKGVLSVLERLLRMSETVVAHNLNFDLSMLEIEVEREPDIALSLSKKPFCTMERSTDVVRIPSTPRMSACGMTQFKNPNLQEAYRHFFGAEFEGAHDAMADVRACRDVFFALKRLEALARPAEGGAE